MNRKGVEPVRSRHGQPVASQQSEENSVMAAIERGTTTNLTTTNPMLPHQRRSPGSPTYPCIRQVTLRTKLS